ncbi:twin transmembrane helix small protein [Phreatobacter stygius]|uniref:Twin transmembrane helix small protein n=1 Tax=Phreatobacter stygius TaxID=1940610 RepID=A0A4D7B593_9HYPH|nr:twin transmembrane helix small protein [Phreatobacter stygius]QCI68564.1 twin transmembrane helix small protein [Phreatobacter stygius]
MTFSMLIPIAIGAVAVVLLMGLVNMLRNGSASRSQNLMRWRVGLQFLAVIIIVIALYLKAG